MAEGYIYCLSNPSISGLLKIGMTTRTPEDRAKELYTTGVATPFNIEFSRQVSNPSEKEKDIHTILEKYRVPNREFFNISITKAMRYIDTYLSEEIQTLDSSSTTNKTQLEFTEEERELLEIRKTLNEKKRLEEEQLKNDEAKVREILAVPNTPLIEWLGLHGAYQWNPHYKSAKEVLEGYAIIEKFRESIEPKVKTLIQEHMKELWDNSRNSEKNYKSLLGNGCNLHYNCIDKMISLLSEGDDRDLWFHDANKGRFTNPPPPL